ncbi:1186_t:CDS:2 [Acaulospora morrowiae]|uniref:RNA polymerase II subunit B1 CTD phosphatase RPAP2 homolog n=1 Tax=Acaulospora morrowiae TaxID=94023 RepID=A0A9N9CQB6_9GLOM|nr:1186_t:CDS:2 [Acaulospora morrowiae]
MSEHAPEVILQHNAKKRRSKKKTGEKQASSGRSKKLNQKQQLLKQSLETRKAFEQLSLEWQEKLYETVQLHVLQESAKYLRPQQYLEVIEERNVDNLCGYPLCSNARQVIKGQFRILNRERIIYDLTELKCYCSTICFTSSKFFATQLSDEPLYLRDLKAWRAVEVIPLGVDTYLSRATLREIVKQELDSKRFNDEKNTRRDYVKSLMTDLPTAPPGLCIKEKDVQEPIMTFGQGHAYDAIEGYRIDFQKVGDSEKNKSPTLLLPKETGVNNEDEKLKTEEEEYELAMSIANSMFKNGRFQYSETEDQEDTVLNESQKQVLKKQDVIPKEPFRTPSDNTENSLVKNEQSPTKSSNSKKSHNNTPVKKRREVLQMSLFGRIWTALDRMTTSYTRFYFKKLGLLNIDDADTKQKVVLEEPYRNPEDNEIMITRIQIFTEKVMECFYLLKSQLSITVNIESELIELMSTFTLDNTSVMRSNLENNILCMVFIYALSVDIPQLRENIFAPNPNDDNRGLFVVLLESMNMTIEELDAFIRILRVGST